MSSNAPDEYVILDKISRFRQDYQMSAITKLVPRFGENNAYRKPWPLPRYWLAPTDEPVDKQSINGMGGGALGVGQLYKKPYP